MTLVQYICWFRVSNLQHTRVCFRFETRIRLDLDQNPFLRWLVKLFVVLFKRIVAWAREGDMGKGAFRIIHLPRARVAVVLRLVAVVIHIFYAFTIGKNDSSAIKPSYPPAG